MTQELSISPDSLRAALQAASTFWCKRATIPILSMVRISFDGERARLSATNLDMAISLDLAITQPQTAEPFDFFIPAKTLSQLASFASSEVILSRAGDLTTIKADDVTATMRELCDALDWPEFSLGSALCDPATLDSQTIRTALHHALGCVSKEETRYYLNGVFWTPTEEGAGLTLVATDGHRLARYHTRQPSALPSFILHTEAALALAARLAADPATPITISAHGAPASNAPEPSALEAQLFGRKPKDPAAKLCIQGANWTIWTKTIDGTYPDYTRVIPRQDTPRLSVTINMAAIKRLPDLGRYSALAKFDLEARALSISDGDLTVAMPLAQCRGIGSFGFNLKYIRSFAKRSPEIKIEGTTAGDPFLVQTSDPDLLQVLMPMRV